MMNKYNIIYSNKSSYKTKNWFKNNNIKNVKYNYE